jgi:MFS-type transporter involved in bile tolerance (Atg22 family)
MADFKRQSLFGWWLFDFSNSIPTVIGGIYFAKWFIEDLSAGSVAFNLLFFTSSIFIVITGRWVGNSIDKHGYKPWIILASVISIVATLLIFGASQVIPSKSLVILSFFLFLVFLFGYQVSRICHNVFLRGIIPEDIQTKMSGYGTAANWSGSIVGIVLTIPIVASFPGRFGRELTFLAAGIAYGILTPIALLMMFRSDQTGAVTISEEKIDLSTWRSLLASIGYLLLVYFFLFDVMATVQRNLPPYLTSVFHMPDNTQAIGFLLILVSALLGGVFAGQFVTFANSHLWLKIGSILLAGGIALVTLNNSVSLWTAFIVAGFSYGILESAIRVDFMGNFSPATAGENFGVLAVAERTSGVLGPLIWIIPFYLLSAENAAYRYAMLLMACLAFAAFLLLFKQRSVTKPT